MAAPPRFPFTKLYWAEPVSDLTRRSNLDGTEAETIIGASPQDNNRGVAVDPVTMLLWTMDKNTQTIRTSKFDGSELTTILTNPNVGVDPSSISVDWIGEKIYWNRKNGGDRDILRANLDGSNIETVITDTGIWLHTVDQSTAKVYYGSANDLRRVDGDGNNDESLYTSTSLVAGIAVDNASDRLYWTDETAGEIFVGNLDGTLAAVEVIDTVSKCYDIVLDARTSLLYYIHGDAKDDIRSINIDGTGDAMVIEGASGVQHWQLALADIGGRSAGVSSGWPSWNIYFTNSVIGLRSRRKT